jgi:phosphoketolase
MSPPIFQAQSNEGAELGYSLMHPYGAVFDNPDLLAFCVVADGEAETGALATSWHSNKFINPARDGAVLPILHLNESKISGPTVLGRMETPQLVDLFLGLRVSSVSDRGRRCCPKSFGSVAGARYGDRYDPRIAARGS